MTLYRSIKLAGALTWCGAVVAIAGTPLDSTLLESLAWIEHQASLVDSARAEFTVTYLPTTRIEMERISALCKYRGNEYRAGGYYLTTHQARRRNYHSIWYRKGLCEREEKTLIARPAIVETTVYDGRDVRTLDGTPGRTCLYISSPASSWVPKSRIQPFSFAFEFRSADHGGLLRTSPERSARRDVATRTTDLLLQHPDETRLTLRLVFDDQRRLVAREAIFTQPTALLPWTDDEPTMYARHEFSQFKPYDVGEGKRLWFPSKAILRYYLGKLPDGSPVQSQAIEVEVSDIEFNSEIADERFTITPPEGIPVHDRRGETYGSVALTY